MDEWIYLVAALAGGFLIGVLVILPFALRARRQRSVPSAVADENVVPLEIIPDDERLPDAHDDHFAVSRGGDPARLRPDPPSQTIAMEWAQRHEGGPTAPGRVKGACSGCGTKLTVSDRKPLRIACPVCGRTRLLT